jgi:peptidoglycan/xylan/chitin deacetylase (PgdA/CDA1 family)
MSTAATCFENQLVAEVRQFARRVQRGAATWTAALLGDALGPRRSREFGILMYHRVVEPVKGHPFPTWNVTPDQFRRQLRGLLQRGFQPWPLRKALEYHRRRLAMPKRVFVVTFDDGYENNYTQAFPILRELNVPATLFLSTAYLESGEPMPSDDWTGKGASDVPPEAWRPLTLAQCREMQASGLVELGGHTHTHQDFRGRIDEFRADLRLNLAFLQKQLGLTDATFAIPYGSRKEQFATAAMSRVVCEAGFLCSLGTEDELCRVADSPFDWGRFNVEQHDTAATLAGKLGGWYSFLRRGVRAIERWSTIGGSNSAARKASSPALDAASPSR